MAESEKTGGLAAGLAHAAAAFANTPFPYLLGVGLMLMGSKWDGHLVDQKGCYQLQEIKGIVYKIDTCTGKTEELKTEAKQIDHPTLNSGKQSSAPAITQANK